VTSLHTSWVGVGTLVQINRITGIISRINKFGAGIPSCDASQEHLSDPEYYIHCDKRILPFRANIPSNL